MSKQSFVLQANSKGLTEDYQGIAINTIDVPKTFKLNTQKKLCCFFLNLLNTRLNFLQ